MADNALYHLTWNDYGELVEELWQNLQVRLKELNVHVDALGIILREGAFTGMPLAYKLNTYKVIPVQFKYMLYDGGNELKQIAHIPDLEYELPDNPVILLCDTFPAGGETKTRALAEFKTKFPTARYIMASIIEDAASDGLPGVIGRVHAVTVDKEWRTTNKLLLDRGVGDVLRILLPWENEGEELAGPNSTAWDYA